MKIYQWPRKQEFPLIIAKNAVAFGLKKVNMKQKIETPDSFTLEKFELELSEFIESNEESLSGAEEVRRQDAVRRFLNNFWCYLPMAGAIYREGQKDPYFPQGKKNIIKFIDEYLAQKRWSFEGVNYQGLTGEKIDQLIELYCALRNAGFNHDELAT